MFAKPCAALLLLCVTLLLSCEKELSIPAPLYKKQAVLTGLLHPDSTINITLSYTARPNTKQPYQLITKATVAFFEDGKSIGLLHNSANGAYRIPYNPKPGKTYRVLADIPDYGHLEAEDFLPSLPHFNITTPGILNPKNYNSNPDFILHFQQNQLKDPYWLTVYVQGSKYINGPGCPPVIPSGMLPPGCHWVDAPEVKQNFFATNNPYCDRFNAFFDTSSGKYAFLHLLRLDPETLPKTQIDLDFTLVNQIPIRKLDPGEGTVFEFIAVGKHFDNYLKTSMISFINRPADSDGALNNPFAEPSPVYTNVKNGLGIFGAMNSQRVKFYAFE